MCRWMCEAEEHQGLAQCTKLHPLIVYMCSHFEELPSMETLESLDVLKANGCKKLKSIQRLSQVTKLQLFNVSRFSEWEELSFGTLVSLEELLATQCEKLKSIQGLAQAKTEASFVPLIILKLSTIQPSSENFNLYKSWVLESMNISKPVGLLLHLIDKFVWI